MNLDEFESAVRKVTDWIPEIEEVYFDYDDYNAGEPFIHMHVTLKEEE